jgi:hypothetical protein
MSKSVVKLKRYVLFRVSPNGGYDYAVPVYETFPLSEDPVEAIRQLQYQQVYESGHRRKYVYPDCLRNMNIQEADMIAFWENVGRLFEHHSHC